MSRRITALLCAALLTLVAACSGSGGSSTSAHDAADVSFATDMIPHHRQAVEMAGLAATRAENTSVTALAASIRAEQQPEITRMAGWLTSWGKAVPTSSAMAHMTGAMPGMMSASDMTALAAASGTAFDRMWVTMMIAHHRGALSMARTEIAHGSNADAVALARSIVATQQAEITRMQALSTTLR